MSQNINWHTGWLAAPAFNAVASLIEVGRFQDFPSAMALTQMARQMHPEFTYQFATELDWQDRYYEQVIYQDQVIPTRANNWHDFFNACIWMLLPQTKRLLNQIHIQEIELHGLNPRSPVRNRVTHFDECGGVLLYLDESHLAALQQHQWLDGFWRQRGKWHAETRFFNFGHANYEMLLQPFVGLTAKYIPVKVDNSFYQRTLSQQYREIDETLLASLRDGDWFSTRGRLKPLPLLGIPGWYAQNQQREFYLNQDYFRPKSK